MRVLNERQIDIFSIMFNFYFELNMVSFYFIEKRYNYIIIIVNKGIERFYLKILNVLRVIDLLSNKFIGKILDVIGDFKGFQEFNLFNNSFDGKILLFLENIIDFKLLDFFMNMFLGVFF